MRTTMLIFAVVLLSCGTQSTSKKTDYLDSLEKSNSAALVNDKELAKSLDAINLENVYGKVEFSIDFDSLSKKKLFLGHVYIIDIARINNDFLIKGASDQVLPHYIFDLTCDSANATFIKKNPTISLVFYSDKIQKSFKDTVTPIRNNILPVYHISGNIITAIKPIP